MQGDSTTSLAALASALGSGLLVVLGLWVLWRIVAMLRHRPRHKLSGRWIVVTGCDSGIGLEVARTLIKRGVQVVACCLTPEGVKAAETLGAAWAPRVDLTVDKDVLALAESIRERCGDQLWGVVHGAGTVLPGFVDYQPIAFYREVMAVNFYAPVLLTQKLLPALRAIRGRVVLVSSVDGIVSLPGNAPYDASKFALEAYADALRVELSFSGVRVSVINPSTLRTPMAEHFFAGHRKAWQRMAIEDPAGEWQARWPSSWLERYIEINSRQLSRIAEDPRHAVADILHALSAVNPRLRYFSGRLAKTLFYWLWVAPESWTMRFKRLTIQPPPPGSHE